MVKVCHITSVHSSNDARIFHKMCASLANAGYETYLVAPGENFRAKGVNVVGAGEVPASRIKRMLFFARAIYKKALEIDADIYHFHDPELLPYGLKLKRRGKVVIYDSHEDYVCAIREKAWIPAPLRMAASRIYAAKEWRSCAKLDALICVTPSLLERFKEYNTSAYMITNYPIADASAQLPPYSRNRNICYAGGITPQWMHENVICALPLCGAQYVLAGQAPDAYLQKLKNTEGWENVSYRGRLAHKDVPALMQSCAAGVALLDYTQNVGRKTGTLGNTKFFEYMQNGLPIICTDFLVWKEIVEKEKCGLCVNPGNVSAIAGAIAYILDHPAEAEEMGKNGRRAVMEQYNWSTQEQKLLELYGELLASRSERR